MSWGIKPCPNCEAKLNEGEPCPECDHVDGDGACECPFCFNEYGGMAGELARLRAEKAEIKQHYDRKIAEVERRNRLLSEGLAGNYWAWQGDGDDHLESLVCPVLIQAADLKEICDELEQALISLASENEGMYQVNRDNAELRQRVAFLEREVELYDQSLNIAYLESKQLRPAATAWRELTEIWKLKSINLEVRAEITMEADEYRVFFLDQPEWEQPGVAISQAAAVHSAWLRWQESRGSSVESGEEGSEVSDGEG